jgi:hypothetical protein
MQVSPHTAQAFHERPSRSAVAPSSVKRLAGAWQRPPRGKPLTGLRHEIGGYSPVTAGGVGDAPRTDRLPGRPEGLGGLPGATFTRRAGGRRASRARGRTRQGYPCCHICLAPGVGWPRLARDGRPPGSQPPWGWGDVATPLRPATGRPSLAPGSSTRSPIGSPYGSLSLTGGLRAYHVAPQKPCVVEAPPRRRWRAICAGGVRSPRAWPPTFFGPSLSAPWACPG